MNRIDSKFEYLKENNKKALIPYICAGDDSLKKTEETVYLLEESGADIIELGIPYSDPLADGPVVQAAALCALNNGFKISSFFDTVAQIRENSQIPLICMVYYSSIIGYGCEKFVEGCIRSGIDGLIVPDLPYEEYDELMPLLENTELYLIPLVAITSWDRIKMLVEKSRGFVYCVSSLGVTGERKSFDERVDTFIKEVKKYTDTPACIGFGISTKEDVERFDKIADGVIVGSAIVRRMHECNGDMNMVKDFVRELKG